MALFIRTNGAVANVSSKSGLEFSRDELQLMVGGMIEVLYLDTGEILICNEEGKIHGLPYNQVATRLCREKGGIAPSDLIMGNAVICKESEIS